MKKLIILSVLVLSLYSCTNNSTLQSSEYPKIFGFEKNDFSNYHFAILKGTDGHEYITNGMNLLLHNPECKLCRSREEEKIKHTYDTNN